MINLQSFNGQKHLFHLVCFGFSFVILNIYSWITLPRGFVNPMAAPALTRLAKKMIAHPAQIAKSNVSWILLHLRKYVIYLRHFSYSIIIGIIVKSCFFMVIRKLFTLGTSNKD